VRCIALPAFQAQIALQRVAKPLFVVSGNHEPDLSANAFLTQVCHFWWPMRPKTPFSGLTRRACIGESMG
jgi:hypothetical protein